MNQPMESTTSGGAPRARRAGIAAAALAAGLLAFVPALPAHAADAPTMKARRHFEKAELAYASRRFTVALEEYGLAHEAKRLPGFLFNMAQCHKRLGDYEKAIVLYERFLRDEPDAPAPPTRCSCCSTNSGASSRA